MKLQFFFGFLLFAQLSWGVTGPKLEVLAAFEKLSSAKGYEVLQSSDFMGQKSTSRSRIQVGEAYELYSADGQRTLVIDSKQGVQCELLGDRWIKSKANDTSKLMTLSKELFGFQTQGIKTAQVLPPSTLEGQPMRVLAYTMDVMMNGHRVTSKDKIFVDAGGQIRMVESETLVPGMPVTMKMLGTTNYRRDDAIEVSLPKGCASYEPQPAPAN